ncbi:hypothetical protein JNB_00315 [Janibacter sp. HTCC2649]|nr:hypothetical protein JNB_00315 [Janibacter sp. HTCC2649]
MLRVQEFWVYAIEFDADWIAAKGRGTVYVGYTARTPEQRLETHRAGGRTAAAIFKVGRRRRATNLQLRMDLAVSEPNHAGPWVIEKEAMKHERKLANRLKARGYFVEVGLGKPFGATAPKPKRQRADPASSEAPKRTPRSRGTEKGMQAES